MLFRRFSSNNREADKALSLTGPRQRPRTAALSGSNPKAPGSAGGYLLPLLLPKFVPEGAAMYHELRKRGTSAVDLKFLSDVRQGPYRNFKSKTALETYTW